jgi:hypothetical protein
VLFTKPLKGVTSVLARLKGIEGCFSFLAGLRVGGLPEAKLPRISELV